MNRIDLEGRTPPGQHLVQKLPVLHYGAVPRIDLDRWELRLFGLLEEEVRWSYDELRALPSQSVTCDIHCVTRWSLLDTVWEGVTIHEVVGRLRLRLGVSHVLIHAEGGYTTNLSWEVFNRAENLLAWGYGGEQLSPAHGWPLRLVVPSRYFWKSAKWVRAIEFLDHDVPGFWEQAGYHNEGDPWKEQRFA